MFAIRPFKLAALAAVTATAGILFVPPAAAAVAPAGVSVLTMPAAAVAPLVGQYNQGPSFFVTISITTVIQGGTVSFVIKGNVNGRQYAVTVFSNPINVGTLTADANGSVSGSFSTAPLDVGDHRIQVVAVGTGETVNIPFTVTGAQGSVVPVGTPTATDGGGLAFTGANGVVPLGALGAVLVLGGGAAVFVTRRRQSNAS